MGTQKSAKALLDKLSKTHSGSMILGKDANVPGWLSTGSTTLDFAIRRSLPGGIPAGRVIELWGKPYGGKSVTLQHIMANAQKAGGQAILYDTEGGFAKKYSSRIGVDTNTLIIGYPEHVEGLIENVKVASAAWREEYPDPTTQPPLVFGWDSIAFTGTKYDVENDNETTRMAELARALSSRFPSVISAIAHQNIYFVAVNQVRTIIGGPASGNYNTPGGLTVPHAASVRIRMMPVGKIEEKGVQIGTKAEAIIIKNRMAGTRGWKVPFEIGNEGIADHAGWLDFFAARGIISKNGGWYSIQLPGQDEPIRFQRGVWLRKMAEDEAYREKFAKIMFDSCQDEENAE
jgi:recombination protein RecA